MTPQPHLTFYVDPAWRRDGIHTPLLNPWWGNPFTEASPFTKQLFDTYSFDTHYYTVTDHIEEADMVLGPYPQVWCHRYEPALFDTFVETARDLQLPLLVDGTGDIERPVDEEHVYVLRYGGYRFLPEKRRIQVPLFTDDLLVRYCGGQFGAREKTSRRPTIGFAGWSTLSGVQRLKTGIKELPVRLHSMFDERYHACTKGVLWRERVLGVLRQSLRVETQFHARRSFSGSTKTAEGDMATLRDEFVQSILSSDYALDIRGDANDSSRLFEITSLGRIPIIFDTERRLPFANELDYSTFALVVDFRVLAHLPDIVADFHAALTPERFVEMQRRARVAYEQFFRLDAATKHIITDISTQVARDHRQAKTM
ncbi:hypothetical protein COU19_00545 [Candidatus Kaiserbacteria bacterium CG10_big_fil_rev_8_21_14_0_10_56_12]|uniref:Exostosin GT47 domain-containing protein n=1 Tax=Candidatus Kaiserbacteria bacterium CG10_big_fil_rev_8_21_14_0_10_56_12 TaxID=1974611 RepID=A0A2H0UCN5_9BACT|nr:MAG: hypothetical protein COU19_00545 [Candidatus Kaiserbacteria bacterium CG10_big_fil_rev_8_21_14_0_10_56_12]